MREWLLLALTFAPVLVLGLLNRGGIEVPDWIRAVGIGWFVVGALILGWYDGWVKRALIGVLIFIPLMGTMLLWSGAVSSGWQAAITIVLIAASVAVLVVIGLATGWFAEVVGMLRQRTPNDARARQD